MNFLEEVYATFPRHIGKRAAFRAIEKAIGRMLAGTEPETDILAQVRKFAHSPAGRHDGLFKGYHPPHPSTFFNQSRYLDDENEWWNGERPKGRCDRHPNSGLTNHGTCWECYAERSGQAG